MVRIHNAKFYKPEPRAIYCMSLQKQERTLAISRSDSSIEIWNLKDSPYIQKIIPSVLNYSIQALTWSKHRLFSCTLQGFLHEYNLKTLALKQKQSLVGEAAYCLDTNSDGSNIVVGTENGYLNIFDLTEEDEVNFIKFLDKQDGKILCVKYDSTGKFIVSGGIDVLRIWDAVTGNALHKMTTGRSEIHKPTVVWCLEVIKDFTIITGDSRGKLTFWDGKIGAQLESYQSHRADILSLALSEDGNTIFSAGADPILISYAKVKIKEQNEKWVKSIQRRIHDHDVRALILLNDRLYSGGIDGYLACSYHPPKTIVKFPPLLQNNCVAISKSQQLVLLQYTNYIEIWGLGKIAAGVGPNENGKCQLMQGAKKLLHLERSVRDDDGESYKQAIMCSSISTCGKWIAFSTSSGCRLYKFKYNDDEEKPVVKRIKALPSNCKASTRLCFTSDSKQLIMALCSGCILVLNLQDMTVSQNIDTNRFLRNTVLHLLISLNGKYLVVADTESDVVVWMNTSKSWKYSNKLPQYHCTPTALAIHPTTNHLWIAYPDHRVAEYSLEQKKFTDFSKELDSKNVEHYVDKHFPIRNITFDLTNPDIVLLHDDANIVVINKSKESFEESPTKMAKTEKNARNPKKQKSCFSSCKKYQHLVHLESLTEDELVVVEATPLALMEQLPPCLKQNTFGAK